MTIFSPYECRPETEGHILYRHGLGNKFRQYFFLLKGLRKTPFQKKARIKTQRAENEKTKKFIFDTKKFIFEVLPVKPNFHCTKDTTRWKNFSIVAAKNTIFKSALS